MMQWVLCTILSSIFEVCLIFFLCIRFRMSYVKIEEKTPSLSEDSMHWLDANVILHNIFQNHHLVYFGGERVLPYNFFYHQELCLCPQNGLLAINNAAGAIYLIREFLRYLVLFPSPLSLPIVMSQD